MSGHPFKKKRQAIHSLACDASGAHPRDQLEHRCAGNDGMTVTANGGQWPEHHPIQRYGGGARHPPLKGRGAPAFKNTGTCCNGLEGVPWRHAAAKKGKKDKKRGKWGL